MYPKPSQVEHKREEKPSYESIDTPNDSYQGINLLDELNLSEDEIAEKLKKKEGPYGNVFTENTIRYCWDHQNMQYMMFDVMTNEKLNDDEVDELGAVNYNRELGLGDFADDDTFETQEGA